MTFRKALFFGILSLSVIASTVAAEQFQQEDFEAFRNRGFCNFMEVFGQEKSKELGLEDPTEVKIKEEKSLIEMKITIPLVAQGHEAVYQRFLNGALIYRPNKGSDDGMVTLPIRELANPLEGTFDLSHCGDAGNYLSISTGYRKGKKLENASKVEIWFTSRFLIEKELNTTAGHFEEVYGDWSDKSPIGIVYTGGRWDTLSLMDYLTTQKMNELSNGNLYEKWEQGCRPSCKSLGLLTTGVTLFKNFLFIL